MNLLIRKLLIDQKIEILLITKSTKNRLIKTRKTEKLKNRLIAKCKMN